MMKQCNFFGRYRRVLSMSLVLAMLIAFVPAQVQAAQMEIVDFSAPEASEYFDLYSTSSGGFAVEDGKLIPTGDAGEFKAIYKQSDKPIRSVSVDLLPVGQAGGWLPDHQA